MNCIEEGQPKNVTSNDLTLKNKIEEVYKLHNALMIEQYIKYVTEDETYSFIKNKSTEFMVFSNEEEEEVVVDEDGMLIKSSCFKDIIEEYCVSRLNKTNDMIEALLFE